MEEGNVDCLMATIESLRAKLEYAEAKLASGEPGHVWMWANTTTLILFATKELAEMMNKGRGPSTYVQPVAVPVIGMATTPQPAPATLQDRVKPWMLECFGAEIAADKLERGDRFLEESLELLQSGDYPKERAYALIEYVYGREKGQPLQEVGGVMITLAAYCLAHGLDMHEAGETELARITQPEIMEKIRRKQAAKPTGSALPIATQPAPDVQAAVSAVLEKVEADMQERARATSKLLLNELKAKYNL